MLKPSAVRSLSDNLCLYVLANLPSAGLVVDGDRSVVLYRYLYFSGA